MALGLATAALVQLADTPFARACGCLSPPAVAVNASDYAINQSSEQIIFEVTPGWVTAHVLIRYAGDPAQFAWLVPVPEVPDLSLSPVSAFGLLDRATAPDVTSTVDDLCPVPAWQCHYDYPEPSGGPGCGGGAGDSFGGFALSDAGNSASDAAGGAMPPVTVINQQVIGDYQTVTFSASDAAAATQWLHDNGFIVNPTTSIYMESYIQQNMVFVAAKLVAGAGISAIKPLRMKYRAAYPSIPLILTAVAAQPNLTVTAFIFGDQPFLPMGHPVVTIDPNRLASDPAGRFNYPMVLARTIDEAGGDGFAIEYRGNPSPSTVGVGPCCNDQYDLCNIGHDNQCECPRDSYDQADCAAQGDLVDGVALLDMLGKTYASLTRITTRISPEEMTFDPTFQPDYVNGATGPMHVHGSQPSLANCRGDVRDAATYQAIETRQNCAAVYCGPNSQCVTTASGPACACGEGTVAQQFIDLDEQPSIACVPVTPPADLRAGGDVLPDACVTATCGSGQCTDRNGIAVCTCDANTAAAVGVTSPSCLPILAMTQSPGADDYSEALRGLDVCAPTPTSCGEYGWLENAGSTRPGLDCGNATPPDWMTHPRSTGGWGCGCQQTSDTSPFAFAAGAGIVLVLISRRRRRSTR